MELLTGAMQIGYYWLYCIVLCRVYTISIKMFTIYVILYLLDYGKYSNLKLVSCTVYFYTMNYFYTVAIIQK